MSPRKIKTTSRKSEFNSPALDGQEKIHILFETYSIFHRRSRGGLRIFSTLVSARLARALGERILHNVRNLRSALCVLHRSSLKQLRKSAGSRRQTIAAMRLKAFTQRDVASSQACRCDKCKRKKEDGKAGWEPSPLPKQMAALGDYV